MNTTTADAASATFTLPENVGLATTAAPLEGGALNPVPGWMDVLREQFATVGLALKREGAILGGFAALFSTFILLQDNARIYLSPTMGIVAAMMATLIPMAVWKGEDAAHRGYHHAMPVGHGAHATAKAVAGLAWVLAGVAAFFGWLGLLSFVTVGHVEAAEPWQWVAPFVGATVTYLLGSALTLFTARPWRWLGGAFVGYFFLGAFSEVDATEPLGDAVGALIRGHYGLRTVLTGLVHNEQAGDVKFAMIADFGSWLTATWIWLAISISLFLWAAYRQPEQ